MPVETESNTYGSTHCDSGGPYRVDYAPRSNCAQEVMSCQCQAILKRQCQMEVRCACAMRYALTAFSDRCFCHHRDVEFHRSDGAHVSIELAAAVRLILARLGSQGRTVVER